MSFEPIVRSLVAGSTAGHLKGRKKPTLNGKSYPLLAKYIYLIRSGEKKVEVRINTGSFCYAKIDDIVSFYTYQGDRITCRVTGVAKYTNFRALLEKEGVANCLPGIREVHEGEKVYHAIPKYEEKAKKFGVVALRILVEDPYPKKRSIDLDINSRPQKKAKIEDETGVKS